MGLSKKKKKVKCKECMHRTMPSVYEKEEIYLHLSIIYLYLFVLIFAKRNTGRMHQKIMKIVLIGISGNIVKGIGMGRIALRVYLLIQV